MSAALRLAWRDLRGGLRGLGLLWLCLTISVAAIALVLSLGSAIDRAISAHGRDLLGGDGILLEGQTLFVVQNRLNQLAVINLAADLSAGTVVQRVRSLSFHVPTTPSTRA